MNIKKIKDRADDLLKDCKPQVMRTLIIMLLIASIPSLFVGNNAFIRFVSFGLSILFLTFSHGQVVTALKVVRNNKGALEDDDALVGFKRYKELFFTYFLYALIIFAVVFVYVIVVVLFSVILYGSFFANLTNYSFGTLGDFSSVANLFTTLGVFGSSALVFFVLLSLIILIAMFVLSLYLFAFPYLLEQYNMRGSSAISESFRFLKGNVWNLFKLQFSFFGWILLFALLEGLLVEILVFIPVLGPIIASIIVGVVAIYVYMPKYIVSMAIFFEEIAYYRYNSNQ